MEGLPETIGSALRDSLGHAGARKVAGERIVGIIGPGVPDALILSCAGRPLHILPGVGPTPMADAFVPGESLQMKMFVEPALDGTLAFLDLLIVTRPHEWLYYTLKEAVRTGEGRLAPLHLHDFVPNHSDASHRHNRRQMDRLVESVSRATGTVPTDAAMAAAIAAIDCRAARLRTLQDLRDAGKISGVDGLDVVMASRLLDAEDFVTAIDPWLAAREAAPSITGPRLVLLPSEAADLRAVHQAAEAAGATIVAEDSDWGSRSAVADVSEGDPLDALTVAMRAASSGPEVQPRAARLAWAEAQMARSDIDGIIFAIPRADRKFGWDYPALRDCAAAAGKPALVLRDDPARDPDATRAALTGFVTHFANRGEAA